MADLVLYVVLAVIGYFIARRLGKAEKNYEMFGYIQTWVIALLVFSMGTRMGANKEVIGNLNRIGLYALLMTILTVAFSVVCVSIVRKILKIDKYGSFSCKAAKIEVPPESDDSSGGGTMTLFIVLSVILGMMLGYFLMEKNVYDYQSLNSLAGMIIKIGLCALLFMVGFDMGLNDEFIENVKEAGFRVLLFPIAICVGTLLGAFICSVCIDIPIREGLAIGAGFGWYSMAPALIMERGFATASAISFMHNIFRELAALLCIPFVAKKIGYLETVAMPGSGASDVCLPLIVKSTKSEIALYSFVAGIGVSLMVPILVPLFLK